jgi:DNA-binding NtrC family response regulator
VEPSGKHALLVMAPSGVFTHALPAAGQVTIGRDEGCDVVLGDVKASRRHALLHLGDPCAIEDLGSTNGTTLAARPLRANERMPLSPGDLVAIGSTVLVLQRAAAPPIRVWSKKAFDERLGAEAARASKEGGAYGVVRMEFEEWASAHSKLSTMGSRAMPNEAARAERVESALKEALRPADVIGSTAPGRYEVLLPATAEREVAAISADVQRRLADAGVACAVTVACYPRDDASGGDVVAPTAAAAGAPAATGSTLDRRLSPVVAKVAQGDINVLILGETGVGKEVLARTIHERSRRAQKALVSINCAALSETLLESELFGHEKGAFTGAVAAKAGLLESADGGTVFLDEVGEMPLALQAKLLRVLEQREVLRVGSLRPRPIDVRFLGATNRDLEAEVAAGRFRQDLYFRLNGVAIVIPPLRERTDEIEALARLFVAKAAERCGRKGPALAPEVLELLQRHRWPGNIRELRNVMERAVLLTSGGTIGLDTFPANFLGGPLRAIVGVPADPPPAAVALPEGDDRARVIAALAACDGNQTHAAKMLGISRRTLITRIEEYDLPRPRKKSDDGSG